jgi:hypothetical protein
MQAPQVPLCGKITDKFMMIYNYLLNIFAIIGGNRASPQKIEFKNNSFI